VILPVYVFGGERCHVGLRAAQLPEQFIIGAGGRIGFAADNFLMFFKCDGAFFLMSNNRPIGFGQNGQGNPAHVHLVIVEAA
jgi:hypothetical protein